MKTEKPAMPTCGGCRHFVVCDSADKTKDALGECFRWPPTVYGEDDDQMQQQSRPFVWTSEQGCGEFARKLDS